jgi:imidazoleglycerol-phosphate dehydratase / histidinol-phosphatase
MAKIDEELAKYSIAFEFKMVCPHGPDGVCDCRKPQIGGLKDFLRTHEVDFANSVMFGDRTTDGEFAKNLGVRFVKIETNQKFELPIDI